MGVLLLVLAAVVGQDQRSDLVIENTCEYRVVVYVRRSSSPRDAGWTQVDLASGFGTTIPLVSPDWFDIRILVDMGNGSFEELGADDIDFHDLAYRADGPFSLDLARRATHFGTIRHIYVPPSPAATALLYTGGGRVVLRFRDAGGLVGHKPRNPIIRP